MDAEINRNENSDPVDVLDDSTPSRSNPVPDDTQAMSASDRSGTEAQGSFWVSLGRNLYHYTGPRLEKGFRKADIAYTHFLKQYSDDRVGYMQFSSASDRKAATLKLRQMRIDGKKGPKFVVENVDVAPDWTKSRIEERNRSTGGASSRDSRRTQYLELYQKMILKREESRKRCFQDLDTDDGHETKRVKVEEPTSENQTDDDDESDPRRSVTPWYDREYSKQLSRKDITLRKLVTKSIRNTQRTYGKELQKWCDLEAVDIESIVESPKIAGYRSKSEMNVGISTKGAGIVGSNVGGAIGSVEAPYHVSTMPNTAKLVVRYIQRFIEYHLPPEFPNSAHSPLLKNKTTANLFRYLPDSISEDEYLVPYDNVVHSGFWRMITIRSVPTGEIVVGVQVCETCEKHAWVRTRFSEYLRRIFGEKLEFTPFDDYFLRGVSSAFEKEEKEVSQPKLVSIFWRNNSNISDRVYGEGENHSENELLWGQEYLTVNLCDRKFLVSPDSFFQINLSVAELLYNKVKNHVFDDANSPVPTVVFDVFCGTGSIGLCILPDNNSDNDGGEEEEEKKKKENRNIRLVGIESIEAAVSDAKKNAELNSISNVAFYCGQAQDIVSAIFQKEMTRDAKQKDKYAVAICDPPRSGLDASTIRNLRRQNIRRLIYVSCNPKSFANDLERLMSRPTKKTGPAFALKKIQAFDMFPNTEHFEVCALLGKVDA